MNIGLYEKDMILIHYLLTNFNDETYTLLKDYVSSKSDLVDVKEDIYPGFSYELHVNRFTNDVALLLENIILLNKSNSFVVEILELLISGLKGGVGPVIATVSELVFLSLNFDRSSNALRKEIEMVVNKNKTFDSSLTKLVSGFISYNSTGDLLDLNDDLLLFKDKKVASNFDKIKSLSSIDEEASILDKINFINLRILYDISDSQLSTDKDYSFSNDHKRLYWMGNKESLNRNLIVQKRFNLIFNSSPRLFFNNRRDNLLRHLNSSELGFNRPRDNEYTYLEKNLKLLTHDGILIYIVASGDLASETDRIGRSELLSKNLVRAVIDLPKNISKRLSIPLSLLVISNLGKNIHFLNLRETKIEPKLIDLFIKSIFDQGIYENNIFNKINSNWTSDLREEYTSSWGRLQESRISGIPRFKRGLELEKVRKFSELVITMSKEDVVNQAFKLSAEKYYYKKLSRVHNPIELDSLLDYEQQHAPIFRGTSLTTEDKESLKIKDQTSVYYLRLDDIDNFGVKLINKVVLSTPFGKYSRFLLEEGDLLITARSSQIKTAVVPKSNIPLIPSENLFVIRVNKLKLNPHYLKVYFDSELGKNQINSFRTTRITNLTSLSVSDLKKLQIPSISIQDQTSIAATFLDRRNRVTNAQKALSMAEENYFSSINKIISTLGSGKNYEQK